MKFASNAEEIRYYTRELLADNKEHTVKEIKNYIESKTNKIYTDGTYSGALRDLVARETEYKNIRRGIYIYEKKDLGLKKSSFRIIQESIDKLYLEISKLNVLDITTEDLEIVDQIKSNIKLLIEIRDKFK